MATDRAWQTWREATSRALYGPGGFFRTQAPAAHFRTSVHVSSAFADAVFRLARSAGLRAVTDVGAGRGELLTTLHQFAQDLDLLGVEVANRPADLPDAVGWSDVVPDTLDGLVIANEWLDDVPLDVVEVDSGGALRLVEVQVETGDERLADPIDGRDLAWVERWWPLADAPPGSRAEVGWPRDDAWAGVVRRLRTGIAVAIDYGHLRERRPYAGTLVGYRAGRLVPPVPDGSCDLTSHVAVDAVARAGEEAGAASTVLTDQRSALRGLGVTGTRPPLTLAHADPGAYLAALARAGEDAELIAPGGLGDFCWLAQARNTELPPLKIRAGG
ncbi:SAM-dependent methyltransferase [Actinopolymorpha alba]|uniref:SAM-dependent methyltransferase n=1 Tax=Actinopolymorpha alba TaxID=533267 RepID=UPI00036C265A|nr:SAM-dependent methyltransferase [Actinopolymorpha alba]